MSVKSLYFLLLFQITILLLQGQPNIVKLENKLKQAKKSDKAKILNIIAQTHLDSANYEPALNNALKASGLAIKYNHISELINSYYLIGECYYFLDSNDRALQFYSKAISLGIKDEELLTKILYRK